MAKRHLHKTGSTEPQPESRMLLLQLGMALVPVGLTVFAWSAEREAHWAIPLAGAAIFALGMLMAYVCIQTYLVDVYESFAASALAATVAVRSVGSCIFSIMGFQLYANLGYAWYVVDFLHTIHYLAGIDASCAIGEQCSSPSYALPCCRYRFCYTSTGLGYARMLGNREPEAHGALPRKRELLIY